MEVQDLSELCRLCLDSTSVLFPFETSVLYTKRSLPQLIKYCVDIDLNGNDNGIAPKNLCQSCLDKLQIVFEFKSKSQESDKYLNQIISHSIEEQEPQQAQISHADEPIITPYNPYPDDEESLLQPMDDDYADNSEATDPSHPEPRRGTRSGEFQCPVCFKSFKYSKPLKNHMKTHKQTAKPQISYYKRKKMMMQAKAAKKPTSASTSRFKKETQPEYDSISPYNSPPLYENEQPTNNRDSSPDFGALMLSTSQFIGDEDLEEEQNIPKTSRTGRILKRPVTDDVSFQSNGSHKRAKNRPSIIPKKTPIAAPVRATKKVEEEPQRKPGPLSKTRGLSTAQKKSNDDEGFAIEGFCEVDITKVLKRNKKSSNRIEIIDDDSQSQNSSASNRSRSRSPSVELIPEVDIFGRS